VPETVTIPSRFNGPLESGNGGYSAGIAAGLLSGAVEAKLRAPVPLDRELAVARDDDDTVRVLDGDELVIEARRAEPGVEVPAAVSVEEARSARERYRGVRGEVFSRCFVCGLDREDAFGVFAGEVEGRELVASPWTPAAWTADEDGNVRPEFVWAVLDCPTYFATCLHDDELPMSVLAQLTAEVRAPARAGEEHVVVSWPLEADGRKRWAGVALLSASGDTLAVGRALMIELRG
jgi:hypothetical protein